MNSRFKSVLAVLLSCLVLGVSSQATVCELACDLGNTLACHGGQWNATDTAMGRMKHCAGSMGSMSHEAGRAHAIAEVRAGDHGEGRCRHSQIAMLNPANVDNGFAAIHWVQFETLPPQPIVADTRLSVASKPPPLRAPVDPLLNALRV